jgi:hypothetical protein
MPVDRTLIFGDGSWSPSLASERFALKHLCYLNQLILYTYVSVSRLVGAPRPGKRLAHLPVTQVVVRLKSTLRELRDFLETVQRTRYSLLECQNRLLLTKSNSLKLR